MILFPITVSAVVFVLTVMLLQIIIPILVKKHVGQTILEIGPNWHKSKEGTPTMGGIAPLLAILIASIIFLPWMKISGNEKIAPFLITLLYSIANASVGIIDDYTKLIKKRNLGLTPLQKLFLQSGFAIAYLFLLHLYVQPNTTLTLPFFDFSIPLGIFWYPIAFLFLLWFVNCANLTDGIDGLAASVSSLIGLFFVLVATIVSNASLLLGGAVLFGGALGFFMFNKHPARIFMGDTGSLFFGALAVGCAFISGATFLFFLPGFVFFIEGISVVLQVVYFKLTHGKRLLRMAPLHHHLEKCGWSEWAITLFFLTLTLLFSSLAILTYLI